MRFLKIVSVAVAVVAGACSTPESEPSTPTATTTATIPSHQPGVITGPAGTLRAAVTEPATRADLAVRFLLIEDSTGKKILERSYREAPAELAEPLPVGRYRIVSWTRECGGSCSGVTDDKLSPPAKICGTRVEVTENVVTTVTINAPVDTDCAMSTAS
jgi:hypothetical protein